MLYKAPPTPRAPRSARPVAAASAPPRSMLGTWAAWAGVPPQLRARRPRNRCRGFTSSVPGRRRRSMPRWPSSPSSAMNELANLATEIRDARHSSASTSRRSGSSRSWPCSSAVRYSSAAVCARSANCPTPSVACRKRISGSRTTGRTSQSNWSRSTPGSPRLSTCYSGPSPGRNKPWRISRTNSARRSPRLMATIDVALRKQRTPEQYRTALEECRLISKQLGQLVERIMTLASLDAGNDRTQIVHTDAAELAAGCVAVIRPLAAANGITVDLHADGPLELDTDPAKLREVLMNLLHNAVEYNRAEGVIELSAWRDGAECIFEVRDTGIGIPPEVQDEIFERFPGRPFAAFDRRSRRTGAGDRQGIRRTPQWHDCRGEHARSGQHLPRDDPRSANAG